MKREGYQHGMVRCYHILPDPLHPRPETRYVNRFDSPPTAGLFTRVKTKPTNHSKFTGKCGRPKCRGCHESPAHKSKDKTKGTQKLRFETGSNRSGFSATGFLAQMDGEEDYCVDERYEKPYGIASLAIDIESGDDKDENDKICDVEFDDETSSKEKIAPKEFDDEDEGWCFVEETL